MKILILNWRDPKHPLAGGAEQMLLRHALYWSRRNANIAWISSRYSGGEKSETIKGINIERIGSQYTIHLLFFLKALTGKFSSYDIVIDCFHFLPFFTPLIINKKKIIAVIHEVAGRVWFDNLFYPFAVLGFFTEPLFFLFYKNIPFITVSPSTAKELIGVGIKKNNITIAYNGVDIPKNKVFYKKFTLPSIAFLNRISSDKGIKDALIAYEIVKKTFPKAQMRIAGKEQEKGLLKTIQDKFISNNAAKYLGYVSELSKQKLLQKSWILVHPSKKEGWGLTVIEANYFGTPVVGYDNPGLRDSIQNEKTGLLVEESPEILAQAIVALFSDNKELRKISQNAKMWAKQFTWEKSGSKSWKIIKNMYDKK